MNYSIPRSMVSRWKASKGALKQASLRARNWNKPSLFDGRAMLIRRDLPKNYDMDKWSPKAQKNMGELGT
jgi:hypothetical protein